MRLTQHDGVRRSVGGQRDTASCVGKYTRRITSKFTRCALAGLRISRAPRCRIRESKDASFGRNTNAIRQLDEVMMSSAITNSGVSDRGGEQLLPSCSGRIDPSTFCSAILHQEIAIEISDHRLTALFASPNCGRWNRLAHQSRPGSLSENGLAPLEGEHRFDGGLFYRIHEMSYCLMRSLFRVLVST